jgi:hypothetical protein
MHTRRQFVVDGTAVVASTIAIESCAAEKHETYADAVRQTWRGTDGVPATTATVMRELVRSATLAPSSHNTQCWTFDVRERLVTIAPDFHRRCPAVDPDDHHLFVSLGCATENLVQAALAFGFHSHVDFDDHTPGAIAVALDQTKPAASTLFAAIPGRQSTRGKFDGTPLTGAEFELLERMARGNGVQLLLITDRPKMEAILELIVEGNTVQMNDTAFVDELKSWIRFSDAEAVATRDGLFTRTSGNPSIPHWIGSPLFPLLYRVGPENEKYVKQVRSSSGIAVFLSAADDPAHWIESGRSFERFALQATAMGVRTSMVNQAVEVSSVRSQLVGLLGVPTLRPDLVVRFGRGREMPRSLRRPVGSVVTA